MVETTYQGLRRLFWLQVRRRLYGNHCRWCVGSGLVPVSRRAKRFLQQCIHCNGTGRETVDNGLPFRLAYEAMVGRAVSACDLLRRTLGDPEAFGGDLEAVARLEGVTGPG